MSETEAILTCAIFSLYMKTDIPSDEGCVIPSEYNLAREVIGNETAFVISVILEGATIDEAVEFYYRSHGIKL